MATLSQQPKNSVREYAATGALAFAFVICLPLLGIVAFMCRGPLMFAATGLLAAAFFAGLWHASAPGLRAWREQRRSSTSK